MALKACNLENIEIHEIDNLLAWKLKATCYIFIEYVSFLFSAVMIHDLSINCML